MLTNAYRYLALAITLAMPVASYAKKSIPSNGMYVSFHKNGQLAARKLYKDGGLDGPQFTFYNNGQLRAREAY